MIRDYVVSVSDPHAKCLIRLDLRIRQDGEDTAR